MKIEDIAQLAGVSKATVSLVLNNKKGVSDKKRAEILEIMRKNNYVPLKKSTKIKAEQRGMIRFVALKNDDIVTDNYRNMPFFNELLSYISEEIASFGYTLVISNIDSNQIEEEVRKLENDMTSTGLILLGTNLSYETIEEIKMIHPNVVFIDTCFSESNANFVSINNFQGAYASVSHLFSKGHRKIAYVQSHSRIENFEQRRRGFRRATRDYAIEEMACFDFPGMEIGEQTGLIAQLKQLDEQPTAFFCENDYIAISLMRTLQASGYRVPQDYAIIGFDDIYEAKVVTPELTTVYVDKKMIASECLRLLSAQSTTKQQSLINANVIERKSV